MSAKTTGFSNRIGDANLIFAMKRFEDSDKNPLWRFSITGHFHEKPFIAMDASAKDALEIKAFCDRVIQALMTDGGRIEPEPKEIAP